MAEEVARLTPHLREHNLAWEQFADFLALRHELFEIDTRYGQLGDKGLFAALDRAGVLDHHVPGVDNIEHAMENPPATGRAHIRGEQIRRLRGHTRRYLCDWRGLWDCKDKRKLDLSDPFQTNAEWTPWEPTGDELQHYRSMLENDFLPF